mmetsp:Transcript_61659/g.133537  ORF Transcript_61659/g.133537 Transcript_61659/m.133537 type:complete len:324 (-) Transcript_61659:2901-3872(-)
MGRDEVVPSIMAISKEFECTTFLDLTEDVAQVAVAAFGDLQVGLIGGAGEEWLRRVIEELGEREEQGHHCPLPLPQEFHLCRDVLVFGRIRCTSSDLLSASILAGRPRSLSGLRGLCGRGVAPPPLRSWLPGLLLSRKDLVEVGAILACNRQHLLEFLPSVLHVVEEEMLSILAGVRGVMPQQPELVREALHLGEQLDAPLQHMVHAAPLGKVLDGVEFFDAASQPEKVPLGNVQRDNLFEEIVQSLVGVGHQDDLLIWEVVKEEVNHLHRRVRLAGPWRPHDHREPWIDTGADGFDLHGCEAHRVLPRFAFRVRAHVGQRVR